jgi:hypothetical protein
MIAMDPHQTTTFTLPEQPDGPTFRTRYLTAREALRADELLRSALEADPAEQVRQLCDLLALGLVDWTGVVDRAGHTVTFDVERLSDVLTIGELANAALALLRAVVLGEADRKKSASRPESSPPASAADVPVASVQA